MLDLIIRSVAIGCGLVVILLPLVVVYRQRSRLHGSEMGSRPRSLRVPAIFAMSAAYILAGILLWRPVSDAIGRPWSSLMMFLGSILYFPGISLYLWGFFSLGAMFAVSSSKAAALYPDHVLIEAGPYRYLRHPMYLGIILAALGAALIFRTWAMILFNLTVISVIIRARREEEQLSEHFGTQWEDYKRRVPGWLPRLRNPDPASRYPDGDTQSTL